MDKFLLYKTETGEVRVEVLVQEETLWLTQKTMGQLFGVEPHTITYHIKEIYKAKNCRKRQLLEKFEQFKKKEIER